MVFTDFVANCEFFLLFYILEHIFALTSYDIIIQHRVSFALYIVLHALLCLQLDAFGPLIANCSVGFVPIIRYWDIRLSNPVCIFNNSLTAVILLQCSIPDGCWHCRSQSDSFQLAEPFGNILI